MRIAGTITVVEVVVCCYTVSDQISLNVRHYWLNSITGLGATQGEFATLLDGVFAPLYKAILSAQARYRGVKVRSILPAPPAAPAWEVASDGVGLVAGDMCPKQTAGVIALQTARSGRAYRGRVYVGMPGEADNAATAVPSAAYVTGLTNIGAAWIALRTPGAAGNTSSLVPGLFHRATGTTTDLTASIARTLWGTQRRRGSFGRPNVLPF